MQDLHSPTYSSLGRPGGYWNKSAYNFTATLKGASSVSGPVGPAWDHSHNILTDANPVMLSGFSLYYLQVAGQLCKLPLHHGFTLK